MCARWRAAPVEWFGSLIRKVLNPEIRRLERCSRRLTHRTRTALRMMSLARAVSLSEGPRLRALRGFALSSGVMTKPGPQGEAQVGRCGDMSVAVGVGPAPLLRSVRGADGTFVVGRLAGQRCRAPRRERGLTRRPPPGGQEVWPAAPPCSHPGFVVGRPSRGRLGGHRGAESGRSFRPAVSGPGPECVGQYAGRAGRARSSWECPPSGIVTCLLCCAWARASGRPDPSPAPGSPRLAPPALHLPTHPRGGPWGAAGGLKCWSPRNEPWSG